MGRVKDNAMDEAERLISEFAFKISDGEITPDDLVNEYEYKLTDEEKLNLQFIGIEDKYDFVEAIENE